MAAVEEEAERREASEERITDTRMEVGGPEVTDKVVVEADGTRRLSPEAEEALAEAEVRGELSADEVTALVPDGVSIDIWES